MPRVEYRVAHWYETFILGLIVATSIWLTLYRSRHTDDSSKSNMTNMTRLKRFYESQKSDGKEQLENLINKLQNQKEVLETIHDAIDLELRNCKVSNNCDVNDVKILTSLLDTFSNYETNPNDSSYS